MLQVYNLKKGFSIPDMHFISMYIRKMLMLCVKCMTTPEHLVGYNVTVEDTDELNSLSFTEIEFSYKK